MEPIEAKDVSKEELRKIRVDFLIKAVAFILINELISNAKDLFDPILILIKNEVVAVIAKNILNLFLIFIVLLIMIIVFKKIPFYKLYLRKEDQKKYLDYFEKLETEYFFLSKNEWKGLLFIVFLMGLVLFFLSFIWITSN